MNTRPDWCPNKTCDCLLTMHDKVCAGYTEGGGRLCILPGQKAKDICALIDLDEGDTGRLMDMIEVIDFTHTHRSINANGGMV